MENEWAKFVVPVLGAFAGSLLANWASLTNNRKNLFVNTVTIERAKWRQDLRLAVSELARTTEVALGEPIWAMATPSSERIGAFHAQRISVSLRINPNPQPRDVLDQTILGSLKRLSAAVTDRNRAIATTELGIIEESVQKLLKQEWDKSKREARTGELDGS